MKYVTLSGFLVLTFSHLALAEYHYGDSVGSTFDLSRPSASSSSATGGGPLATNACAIRPAQGGQTPPQQQLTPPPPQQQPPASASSAAPNTKSEEAKSSDPTKSEGDASKQESGKTADGSTLFKTKCLNCHEGTPQSFKLKSGSGVWGVTQAIASIERGSMPKDGKLSEDEKKTLVTYLKKL